MTYKIVLIFSRSSCRNSRLETRDYGLLLFIPTAAIHHRRQQMKLRGESKQPLKFSIQHLERLCRDHRAQQRGRNCIRLTVVGLQNVVGHPSQD